MYRCLNTTFDNLDTLFLCCLQRIVTGCIGYHCYDVITISGYHVLDCRYGCCRIVIEACRYIIPSTVVTFLVKLLIDSNHKLRLECRRQESYLYTTSGCAALSCGTSCHHCYCHNYCQQNTKQFLSFFHSHFLLIFFVFSSVRYREMAEARPASGGIISMYLSDGFIIWRICPSHNQTSFGFRERIFSSFSPLRK